MVGKFLTRPLAESLIFKEVNVTFNATCQIMEDSKDLPKLPMTAFKSRDGQKHLVCSMLDTGTSTSILASVLLEK